MRVIDLIESSASTEREIFFQAIEKIDSRREDDLWKNYVELKSEYAKYENFHVIIEEGANTNLVAFAALQCHGFSEMYCRALTRSFVMPQYRATNTFPRRGANAYLSDLVLPLQVENAIKRKKAGIFVSFENLSRKSFMKKWITSLNNEYDYPNEWKLLDGVFQTCVDGNNRSCWQLVAFLPLIDGTSYDLPLRRMTESDYRRRFPEDDDEQ